MDSMWIKIVCLSIPILFLITSLVYLYFKNKSVYINSLIKHSVDKSTAINWWKEQRWYIMKKSIKLILRRK